MSATTDKVIDYLNDHKTLSDHPVLQAAIDRYGSMQQINMIIEECLELAQALHKIRRMSNEQLREGYVEICDEVADVLIMMEQAKKIFDITTINERVSFKLDRLEGRMEQSILDGPPTNEWPEVDELLAKMKGKQVNVHLPDGIHPEVVELHKRCHPTSLGWRCIIRNINDEDCPMKDSYTVDPHKDCYMSKDKTWHCLTIFVGITCTEHNDVCPNNPINKPSENFAEQKELHVKCNKNPDDTWHCIHGMPNCPTHPIEH